MKTIRIPKRMSLKDKRAFTEHFVSKALPWNIVSNQYSLFPDQVAHGVDIELDQDTLRKIFKRTV